MQDFLLSICFCDHCKARAGGRNRRGRSGVAAGFRRGSKLLLGMRCFTPEYADGAALIDKVRAARRMGVEDFRFYNYGLIPQSHLDWIREALQ